MRQPTFDFRTSECNFHFNWLIINKTDYKLLVTYWCVAPYHNVIMVRRGPKHWENNNAPSANEDWEDSSSQPTFQPRQYNRDRDNRDWDKRDRYVTLLFFCIGMELHSSDGNGHDQALRDNAWIILRNYFLVSLFLFYANLFMTVLFI